MTSAMLWSCIGAMLTPVCGLFTLLLLVDCWRYPRRKTVLLIVCLFPVLPLSVLLLYLRSGSPNAILLSLLTDGLALLLLFLVAPARQGRLLFVALTADCMLFVFTHTISALFPQESPSTFMIRWVSWGIFLLFVHRFFRPSLFSLLQADVFLGYRACLLPLMATVIYCYFLHSVRSISLDTLPYEALFPGAAGFIWNALVVLLAALSLCIYGAFYQFLLIFNRYYLRLRDSTVLSAQLKAMTQGVENERLLALQDEVFYASTLEFLDRLEQLARSGANIDARLLLAELDGQLQDASQYALRSYTRDELSRTF